MAKTTEVSEKRGVQSVDFIGNVLQALAAAPGPLNLKTLSDRTRVPAAKLHRYLTSLIRIGLATQHVDGKYDLGPLAIRVGVAAIGRRRILDDAEHSVREILERHGYAGHFSVWGEHGPVIVRTFQGGTPFITSLGLGRTLPLGRSATGLVYLSALNERVTEPLLATEVPDEAARQAIRNKARKAKAEGMAIVDGTVIPGLAALAVPVFEFDGELAFVVTVTTNAGGFGSSQSLTSLVDELKSLSLSLSGVDA